MRFFLFVARRFFTVAFALALATAMWFAIFNGKGMGTIWVLFVIGALGFSIVSSFSHAHRVHLITDRIDASTLASRHRRQIEIPFPPDAGLRPGGRGDTRTAPRRDGGERRPSSLQVHARVRRMDPYAGSKKGSVPAHGRLGRATRPGARDRGTRAGHRQPHA